MVWVRMASVAASATATAAAPSAQAAAGACPGADAVGQVGHRGAHALGVHLGLGVVAAEGQLDRDVVREVQRPAAARPFAGRPASGSTVTSMRAARPSR